MTEWLPPAPQLPHVVKRDSDSTFAKVSRRNTTWAVVNMHSRVSVPHLTCRGDGLRQGSGSHTAAPVGPVPRALCPVSPFSAPPLSSLSRTPGPAELPLL